MNFNEIITKIETLGIESKNEYKREIEQIMASNDKYLLITDDKLFLSNYKLKFVDLIPFIKETSKLCIHPSKFIFLAWQGLINVYHYDVIIINCEIKADFIHAFKIFYIDGIAYDLKKPKCISFIKDPTDDFSIYFQSILASKQDDDIKNNIKCITISSKTPNKFINYAKCKRLLKNTIENKNSEFYVKLLNRLSELEKSDILEAIELISKCINQSKISSIPPTDKDLEYGKSLSILFEKQKIIKNYLQCGPVYIYGHIEFESKDVYFIKDFISLDADLEESTLFIIDPVDEKILPKFKTIIFLKESESFPTALINNICKLESIDKFYSYFVKKDKQYNTREDSHYINPTLPWEYSIPFYEHIFYLINRLFHENYLFIRCLVPNRIYYNGSKPNTFICCLEFPKIVNNNALLATFKSDEFSVKKDANKDACYRFIIKLVESGYLDSNFLPVKSKFINENLFYIKSIKKIYDIDFQSLEEAYVLINNIKDGYEEYDKFKKDYYFDITQKNFPFFDPEEVLRKQADCFKCFSDTMSLYLFNNSNIGICTGETFTEKVNYKNTEVRFIKRISFTQHEKNIILNFQVVFFGVNFKRITCSQTVGRKYAYYVLPIKNLEIDFEYMNELYENFFFGSVYDVNNHSILNNYLLFNPITKLFYEYVEDTDKKFTDITNSKIKNRKNLDSSKKEYTFLEYFIFLYGINLSNSGKNKNVIFTAVPFSHKKEKEPEFHACEIIYVTVVKKSIKSDYKRFVEYFNIFEILALTYEFKVNMNFSISHSNLAISFTLQDSLNGQQNDLGYERFEFIGDSVLKYSVSKFLFTECGYNLNKLVSTKDGLVCNDHLYRVGRQINLQKYFSLNRYTEHLFQPPAILDLEFDKSLIESLNLKNLFQNNNQYNFVKLYSRKQSQDTNLEKGKKVYADIVESLIGVHYIEQGFQKAWNFIKSIGILENHGSKRHSNNFMTKTPNIILLCEYEGILPLANILKVEKIINYTFKNKGYIEKAMIHPSYKDNIFGSERFQKLELVGDCFLDLKVSDYIFFKYTDADPETLHTHRKSLVNNHTFAMILFKSGLYDFSFTGLSDQTRDFNNNKVSKCYGDIFEALAGAVILDSEFDFEMTDMFFKTVLKLMTENVYEC